jgi:flagellar protein FliL
MTGNTAVDKLIMGLCLLVGLSVTGLFVYTEMLYKKKLPDNATETQAMLDETKQAAVVPAAYKIERIVVNLPTGNERMRYLELGLSITPFRAEHVEQLQKSKEVVNDGVIAAATGMTAQDLSSVTGKIVLEERIKKAVHERLGGEIIKEIFFTKFVVQ